MTTIQDVFDEINRFAPFSSAEEWDNPGLLIGDPLRPIHTAMLALDADDAVVDTAIAQHIPLIITHHPVIFHPLRQIVPNSPVARLVAANIAVISAHTNLDKASGGMNDVLAAALGLSAVTALPDGYCRKGTLSPIEPEAFARFVAQQLHTAVRIKTGAKPVRTVVVCSGAGGDLALAYHQQVDAVVTGELHHHEWLSLPPTLTVVEAGHYATEIDGICGDAAGAVLPDSLPARLRQTFPEVTFLPCRGNPPYDTIKD